MKRSVRVDGPAVAWLLWLYGEDALCERALGLQAAEIRELEELATGLATQPELVHEVDEALLRYPPPAGAGITAPGRGSPGPDVAGLS